MIHGDYRSKTRCNRHMSFIKRSIVYGLCSVVCLVLSNECDAKRSDIIYPLPSYQEGVRLHEQGDLKRAVQTLNDALIISPNDLPTLVELAEVLIKLSEYDLAVSTLKHAAQLSGDDALIHILLAKAYQNSNKFTEAISEYLFAIKLEPENVLLRTNLGLLCFYINDYECAVDNLGRVVIAYPDELRARAALGASYHAQKKYSLAKEQYNHVLGHEPENLSLLYNLSKSQIALGEYNDALKSINKAISIDGSISELYLDKGLINYKLNNLEEAQEAYLQALKLDPLNPVIPAEYGIFLWKTGAYLKAAKQYEEALALEPDNKNYMLFKAYLLQQAKQKEHSILAWNEILDNYPEEPIALFNLAKLFQGQKDYKSAINYYRLLLSKSQFENDFEAESSLAYCLHKNKNYAEAKGLYERILSKKPDESNILFNLGILLNEEKNYNLAVQYLDKALKNNFSQKTKVYKALILAYTELKDINNLKTTYKKWLDVDKNNIEARIKYAKFLASNGYPQEASDQYRVAAALDSSPDSRYQLAQFLVQQKDHYGAIAQLQEYLKLKPNDLNALILLANSYKDLGIQEEAVNNYKKIISLQYDNYLAYYNLGLLYHNKDDYEMAQNYFLKVIELNDKYSPAYYALALSYMTDKEGKKAEELFKKYLEIDPDGEYREQAKTKLEELLAKPNESNESKEGAKA